MGGWWYRQRSWNMWQQRWELAVTGTPPTPGWVKMPIQGGFGLWGAVRRVAGKEGYSVSAALTSPALPGWIGLETPDAGWHLLLLELSSQETH